MNTCKTCLHWKPLPKGDIAGAEAEGNCICHPPQLVVLMGLGGVQITPMLPKTTASFACGQFRRAAVLFVPENPTSEEATG